MICSWVTFLGIRFILLVSNCYIQEIAKSQPRVIYEIINNGKKEVTRKSNWIYLLYFELFFEAFFTDFNCTETEDTASWLLSFCVSGKVTTEPGRCHGGDEKQN